MAQKKKDVVERIKHFTPSWFAVVMGQFSNFDRVYGLTSQIGTGIVGILINNLPYGRQDVRDIVSLAFLVVNSVLFVSFLVASIARYIMFPRLWYLMLMHPVQSLFLSCFPMGFATIISASLSLSLHRDIPGLTMFLWGMWWLDVVLSVASCILLPYVMITHHKHSIEQQNATWLLPVVPPIVAASLGSVLCNALVETEPGKAAITVAVSCGILAMGLSLAIMIGTTYLLRMIVHGIPKAGLVVSVFLPLGPCGQGGYALLTLSQHFATLILGSGVLDAALYGKIAICIAASGALVLWAIGLWFAAIATLGLLEASYRNRVPFGVNFWGIIFPNGVYSLLTLQLGDSLELEFFRVVGTIFSGLTAILWLAIACKTIYLAYGGSIFHAPCLDDAPLEFNWPQSKGEDDNVAKADAPPASASPLRNRGPSQEIPHPFE